jgi:catechol 2,3-dioxygenase-like lactoylglutathione lyase family enzyme
MSPSVEISVNIDVPDLEAAIEFYRSAFGLHLGRRLFEGSVVVKDLSPQEAGLRFSVIRRSTTACL